MGGNTDSSISYMDDFDVKIRSRIHRKKGLGFSGINEASQNLEASYLSNQCKLKSYSNIFSVQEYTLQPKDNSSISCVVTSNDGSIVFIGYHNGTLKKIILYPPTCEKNPA